MQVGLFGEFDTTEENSIINFDFPKYLAAVLSAVIVGSSAQLKYEDDVKVCILWVLFYLLDCKNINFLIIDT